MQFGANKFVLIRLFKLGQNLIWQNFAILAFMLKQDNQLNVRTSLCHSIISIFLEEAELSFV